MTLTACVHVALVAALLAVGFPLGGTGVSPVPDDAPKIDFDRDVKPIFVKRCMSCHGPEKPKNGLRLDRKADAMAVIVSGKPADSLLFQLVTGQDKDRPMPPKGPLPAAEIATLKAWIDQGAKWPDDGSTDANPADWWSLKPLHRPAVPDIRKPKVETRNHVDRFVLAEL